MGSANARRTLSATLVGVGVSLGRIAQDSISLFTLTLFLLFRQHFVLLTTRSAFGDFLSRRASWRNCHFRTS